MIIALNTTSVSLDVQLVDDGGLPVTGKVAGTFPAISWSLAGANGNNSIALSDLSTLTTAWTSGGVKERANGYYRLDVPNAIGQTAGVVTLEGEGTNLHLLAPRVEVAVAVVANNLPVDYLNTTEAGQLTTTVADLVTLLSEGANIAGIQSTVNTINTLAAAIKAKTDTLAVNVVPNVFSPLLLGGVIQLIRGDDFYSSERTVPVWNNPGWWPDLTGSAVRLIFSNNIGQIGAVTVLTPSGNNAQIKVEFSRSDTARLLRSGYYYNLVATLPNNSDVVTLASGKVSVGT